MFNILHKYHHWKVHGCVADKKRLSSEPLDAILGCLKQLTAGSKSVKIRASRAQLMTGGAPQDGSSDQGSIGSCDHGRVAFIVTKCT